MQFSLMNIFLTGVQPSSRSAVKLILEQQPGIKISGEAGDDIELLQRLQSDHHDLILVDYGLKNDPLAMLEQIKLAAPEAGIVVYNADPENFQPVLQSGAAGIIPTGESPERFVEEILRHIP